MFIHRVLAQPAIGQAPALRDAFVARSTSANPIVVAQRLLGPAQFSILRSHETLAAFEAWRRGFTPDPAIAKLLGAPNTAELWEITVPAPTGAPPKFSSRFTFHAATGAIRDLRAAVEERTKTTNAAGTTRSSVWLRVSGGRSSVAVVNVFQSLADLEKIRAAAIVSAEVQAYVRKIAPLLAESPETPDLFELLAVPAQA